MGSVMPVTQLGECSETSDSPGGRVRGGLSAFWPVTTQSRRSFTSRGPFGRSGLPGWSVRPGPGRRRLVGPAGSLR
jgi:hypothetical protein